MYALALSWEVCINGGRKKSHVTHSSSICPPSGILKLNFDGSFIRDSGKGRFGGIIRDSSGQVVKRFSGVVDCSDANGAEVHAMLVDCRLVMTSFNWMLMMLFLRMTLSMQSNRVQLLLYGLGVWQIG